jgi:circadian clock protein KaiC
MDDRTITTGVTGLDRITGGGLPRGRVISIFGSAGAGKTILGLQILAHRVKEFGEKAVLVSFEQSAEGVLSDVSGFSWGRDGFSDDELIVLETGVPADLHVSGQFDMQGLIATLLAVTEESGAEIVLLDGLDALLSLLLREEDERRELLRLTDWVRMQGLTVLITAKSSTQQERSRTRAEILDYQTDCVLVLDRPRSGNAVSRTLQVTKYRGADHSGQVCPVVITGDGIEVLAVTSPASATTADEPVTRSSDRLPTGVEGMDALLGGGYLVGSRTLLSGAPGTAKSTLAAAFSLAVVERGGRVLYASFDEVTAQIELHMRTVGYGFREHLDSGAIRILELSGAEGTPEEAVLRILRGVDEIDATALIIDPVSAITGSGRLFSEEAIAYLLSALGHRGVTVLLTSLLTGQASLENESTRSQISTIADNWIHLSYIAAGGERNRALTVVKSRGSAHTNQVRELLISSNGIELRPAYSADGDVLLGSARAQKEEADRTAAWQRAVDYEQEEALLLAAVAEMEVRATGMLTEAELRRRDLERLRAERAGMLERSENAAQARIASRTPQDDGVTG